MSKSVRLPDYLADEVERLAKEERRSLANMVQLLLEQALRLNEPMKRYPLDPERRKEPVIPQAALIEDAHFRPDPK